MYFIRLKDGSLAAHTGGLTYAFFMAFTTAEAAQAVADFWTNPKSKQSPTGIAMFGGKDHTGGVVEHLPDQKLGSLGLIERIRKDQGKTDGKI